MWQLYGTPTRSILKIQRRVARWVTGNYHWSSSVSDMIMALNWPTLEQRCYNSRLITFYKLVRTNSFVNMPPHYSLLVSTYNTCQFHPLHLTVPWSSTSYYQMSFFPKTIRKWNKLPHGVIESDSINEFSDYFC